MGNINFGSNPFNPVIKKCRISQKLKGHDFMNLVFRNLHLGMEKHFKIALT